MELRALAQHQREREPEPEGKLVEEIRVAAEEIFGPEDPYPQLLNRVHVRTRDEVILREVLLSVGSPYQRTRAEESERNLRRIFGLAVARVVPVKGTRGGVGVLVVTKDRWSLRLNSDFNFVGPILQFLRLRPTEQNFLGLDHQLLTDFTLRLDTFSVGQLYQARRLFGTELTAGETASLVFNRQTGALEGSTGQVLVARPLLSLDSTWGFSASAQWRVQRQRIFRGASVWELEFPSTTGPGALVPYVYDVRELDGAALYTRSFGRAFKTDLSAGVGSYQRRYTAPAALDETQRAWLTANHLPRSEAATYLTAQLRAYQADFRVLRDLDTFSLSEDYQLGYSTLLVLRWADPAFLSPTRFVELGATARYRLLLNDDLATVAVAASARFMPEVDASGAPWVNRRLAAEVSNYSPPVAGGRFVVRGAVDLRWHDLDHRKQLLGGGNGLRGAAPESLSGRNLALVNLEYRTRSFEVRTVYLGFVLFSDAGSAFDQQLVLTHTFGLGVRILIPQFNHETIRIDFGVALSNDSRTLIDRFSGSFGQITDRHPSLLDYPLN